MKHFFSDSLEHFNHASGGNKAECTLAFGVNSPTVLLTCDLPMIFHNLISFILFVLLSFSTQAQSFERSSVSGIVHSQAPVESADCYLKNNEHIGTVTNAAGYFHLSFPKSMLYDTLVILAMGFERKEVPLASVNLKQDTVSIYLDQQSIVLHEVLIESTGLNLKDMVLKAVRSVPDNYPNKIHQLRGLYRKVSTKGTRFTHLEEAVIVVEDNGYQKPPNLLKIKTEHYRQSKDWGDVDSSYITMTKKMDKAISRQLKISSNPLNRLYESNGIRHYYGENAWFNFKAFRNIVDDHFTFELRNISVDNGDTLYQVAFAANPVPPPPDHVSGRNYLIINASDLAIVEMQFTLGFDDGPLMSQSHVRFHKIEGRYYPKYVRSIKQRHINRKVDDEEYDILTFWFDDVKLKAFQRIKSSEANDPNESSSHQRNFSASNFWNSTPLIQKHPLEKSVLEDLQRHEPLEEQFLGDRSTFLESP